MSRRNVANPAEELLTLVKKNSSWYKGVIFYCVIAKQEGKNILYRAKVIFQHKSENDSPDLTYDYGSAILASRKMSLEELYQLVVDIPKKTVNVKDLKSIEIGERWENLVDDVASNTRYNDIIYDWPTQVFHLADSSNIHIEAINEPMIGSKCPTFPNLAEATHSFLNLQEYSWNNTPYGIQFLLPDYRGRIKSAELSENTVRVVAETRELKKDDVILKVHAKDEKNEFTPEDIKIDSEETIIRVPFNFKEMNLFLVDKNENQIVDHITYGNYMTERHKGIIIKTSTDLIESLIIKGENLSVEFKEELNNDEFLESVSSFSNTKGGRIILGVDDRRNILGIYDNFDNLQKSIHGMVNGRIEPHILVDIEKLEIQNKPIVVVTVNEGNDKPYLVKGKSAYTRVGEHDISMSRLELDKIYSTRQGQARIPYSSI